jgi:hypothetical protein
VRRRSQNDQLGTHEDLLQDGFRRILQVLGTPRGTYAERAWHSFCRHEVSEAWRERYGRRGERVPLEQPLDAHDDDQHEPDDLFAIASEIPPWHSGLEKTQVARIEEITRGVTEDIPDDFLRQLAYAAWSHGRRPAVSGRGDHPDGPDGKVPLTTTFKDKSRHQITRALRQLDARLAAALLAATDLTWTPDMRALLERLRGNGEAVHVRER